MGVLFMLMASASFATMSARIKGVGPGIPPLELVFLRCLLALPLLYLFVRLRRRPLWVRAKKVFIIRTLFGMTAMAGFFYALLHMPLAECIFIGRSQPLILSLLAPVIIGECTPRAAWFAILAGLSGVALIMRLAMAWPLAAWVALGAATASGVAHLFVRGLNANDYPLVIVFNFTGLTALIAALLVLPAFEPPSGRQWVLILGIAVLASLGQLLMTLAYQKDRAPVIAAASDASVALSVVYGHFFWGETPHLLAWAGGALIVMGGLLLLKGRLYILEAPSPAAT